MEQNIVSYRVIADHGRAATFLMGDGVIPGNNGADTSSAASCAAPWCTVRKHRPRKPFLGEIAKTVMELMGDIYPEIAQQATNSSSPTFSVKKNRSVETLVEGSNRFDRIMSDLNLQIRRHFPGDEMFTPLRHLRPFPRDRHKTWLSSRGFDIDEPRLTRKPSTSSAPAAKPQLHSKPENAKTSTSTSIHLPQPTEFLGYDYSYLSGRQRNNAYKPHRNNGHSALRTQDSETGQGFSASSLVNKEVVQSARGRPGNRSYP